LAITVLSLTLLGCGGGKSPSAASTPAKVRLGQARPLTDEMAEDRNVLLATAQKDLDCTNVEVHGVVYASETRTSGLGDPEIAQETYKKHGQDAYQATGCGRTIEYLKETP